MILLIAKQKRVSQINITFVYPASWTVTCLHFEQVRREGNHNNYFYFLQKKVILNHNKMKPNKSTLQKENWKDLELRNLR